MPVRGREHLRLYTAHICSDRFAEPALVVGLDHCARRGLSVLAEPGGIGLR